MCAHFVRRVDRLDAADQSAATPWFGGFGGSPACGRQGARLEGRPADIADFVSQAQIDCPRRKPGSVKPAIDYFRDMQDFSGMNILD